MKHLINKITQGDCFEVMKEIPDRNIVMITDPPYGIDYDPQFLSDMNIAKGTVPNKTNKKVIGDEKPMDLSVLFSFSKRCIFGFPYIYDKNATGWIVWDKQPQIDGRGITTPVEIASTTLRKGFDLVHCMWAGFLRDIPDRNIEQRFAHPTQKPLKVMKFIINKFTKETDIIFDPFAGSGSTLVAAKHLGRKYIGIEISPEYCKIAEERLQQEVLI